MAQPFAEYDHVVSDSDSTLPILKRSQRNRPKSTFFPDTDTDEEHVPINRQQQLQKKVIRDVSKKRWEKQKENIQFGISTDFKPNLRRSKSKYNAEFSFPTTRSVLWDRRPIGVSDMIRTLDILPNVHIPPRLAQQIKDLSDEETLGFIEGYVSSIRHPKAIELKQIRMTQKLRRQRGNVWDITAQPEGASNHDEKTYRSKIADYQLECQRCDISRNTAYLPINATLRKEPLALHLEVILPLCTLTLTPIRPLSFLDTPLSDLLLAPGPSNAEQELQTGYLTMESRRKLVPLSITDPLAVQRPLVGIWVSGLGPLEGHREKLCHPYLWSMCVRYLHNDQLEERVAVANDTFLVVVCSGPTVKELNDSPKSEQNFFECKMSYSSNVSAFGLFRSTSMFSLNKPASEQDDVVAHFEPFKSKEFEAAIDAEVKQESTAEESPPVRALYTELETPFPQPQPSPQAPPVRKPLNPIKLPDSLPPVHSTLPSKENTSDDIEITAQLEQQESLEDSAPIKPQVLDAERINLNQRWMESTKQTVHHLKTTLDGTPASALEGPYHNVLMAQQQQLSVLQRQIADLQQSLNSLSKRSESPVKEVSREAVIEFKAPEKLEITETTIDSSESEEGESDESFEKLRVDPLPAVTIDCPSNDSFNEDEKMSNTFDFPKIKIYYDEEENEDEFDEELYQIELKYCKEYGIN